MINALIVDDELHGRETMLQMLTGFCPNVKVLACAGSIEDALTQIQLHSPQLLFLDIQMQYGTAFDLLQKFEKPDFQVIFVTGYAHYALNAIKFSALDYLLKPVNIKELIVAVDKAERQINSRSNHDIQDFLKQLNFSVQPFLQVLRVPNAHGFDLVHAHNIVRCEADKEYTSLFVNDGTRLLSSFSLGNHEDILNPQDFFRIHNSHLVSRSYIRRYVRGEGGTLFLSDGVELPVSRRRKQEFLDWLKG